MKPNQIAAQLYTTRSLCKTPIETADTLKKIAEIGYAAVEVAGICPIEAGELNQMVEDVGLKICSIHGRPEEVLTDPNNIIQRALQLKSDYVCYPFPKGFDFSRSEDILRMKESLASAGRTFQEHGLTLCYHHHSLEFARHGTITVLEYLFRNTDAKTLNFELDTYWIQHGGGNPATWCQFAKARLPLLHLKDYGCIQGVPKFMEIGNGNLDWNPIIDAAEESGCKWFIVEQDETPGDPLESLRVSYENLLAIIR